MHTHNVSHCFASYHDYSLKLERARLLKEGEGISYWRGETDQTVSKKKRERKPSIILLL